MPDSPSIAQQLSGLRASYVASLPERLDLLRTGIQGLFDGPWNPERAADVYRVAHNLTGSGATFGFDRLSQTAQTLEELLKVAASSTMPPDKGWRDAVSGALGEVAQEIGRAAARSPDVAASPVFPIIEPATDDRVGTVLLVEDDAATAKELVLQLRRYGHSIRHLDRLSALVRALEDSAPVSMLIADDVLPDGRVTQFMRAWREAGRTLPPTLIISANGEFETRLAAVRAGAAGFLSKPLDASTLVDRMASILWAGPADPCRIVIVPKDADAASRNASHLRTAGMDVEILRNPTSLLARLGSGVPDLLLLDVQLPGCSGFELAAVVRQLETYASLPIVFLSGDPGEAQQLDALETGGEDFLVNPVSPERLVATVRARVRRARALHAVMTHDSLTNLLNHSAIKEALARELVMARRAHQPLAVALIDVDRFKDVNDRHGHLAGDRVLRRLAYLLTQRLRRTDLIGRYGGEEFLVVFPNTDLENAWRVLDILREDYAGIAHYAEHRVFHSSFSAGVVVETVHSWTPADLINAADKALYAAKNAGRNCVVRAFAGEGGSG